MNKKNNIILIGYMGCGKTSVGERLAKRMSYLFLDTDQMLEEKEMDTINHIFSIYGEEYFRNRETELIQELLPKVRQAVLSTGGGLPIREQNTILLKELGYVVYLKASIETTMKRLTGDTTRPLLQGDDSGKRIEQMLADRIPFYEKAADKVIDTDEKSIDEIVNVIIEELEDSL